MRPASTAPRRSAALAAAVCAVLAVVLGGAWIVFRTAVFEPPGAPPAPPPRPPERRGAEIRSLAGVVERGRSGAWEPAAAGDVLAPDEALRTGPSSRAELALGPGAFLHIDEGTEIEVRELGDDVHAVHLARGRLGVEYGAEAPRVRVEGRDGVAVAGRATRFTVVAGAGGFAVATETGVVDLSTPAGSVEVGAGTQASAGPGAAPTPPAPIPAEVVLKVSAARAARRCPVRGWVAPGTEVRVDGAPVEVAPTGRFDVSVPASPEVTVWARDVGGRIAERRVACLSPSVAPVTDFSVRWGRDPAR
jgi:hypothetical protein